MAKSFDELANRTMTPQSRARAAGRTRHILTEMLLADVCAQSGQSQSELARARGAKLGITRHAKSSVQTKNKPTVHELLW